MPQMDGIKSTKFIRSFLKEQMKLDRDDQPKIVGVTGHANKEF